MEGFVEYIKSLEKRIEKLENKEIVVEEEVKEEVKELVYQHKVRGEIGDFLFRGNGKSSFDGEVYRLYGNQPRLYGKKYFKNVEAKMKYKRVGNDGANWGGGVIGVRSHEEGHSLKPDLAHTYYFRLRHDMKVDFYRELEHGGKNNKALITKPFSWESGEWYEVKIKCYNEMGKVVLEGYVNDELVLEYEDDNEKMFNAEGIVFIRNTNVKEAMYKDFYAKEIEGDIELGEKLRVGYYPEWGIYKNFSVEKVDFSEWDYIIYAFVFPQPTQRDLDDAELEYPPVPYNPGVKEGVLVKHDEYAFDKNMEKLRGKNVLLSIGGWTLSFNMSKVMRTDLLRRRLINSIVEYIEKYDLMGVELDWEYPNRGGRKQKNMDNQHNENDGEYLLKFFKELREKIPDKIIATAVGLNDVVFNCYVGTEKYVDYYLIMMYDYGERDVVSDRVWLNKFQDITKISKDKILVGLNEVQDKDKEEKKKLGDEYGGFFIWTVVPGLK